jgi:type II secretory pathway component HofQ
VISRPRIIAANRLETSIEQNVNLSQLQGSDPGMSAKEGLRLKLSPMVRPDGRIWLNIVTSYSQMAGTVQVVAGGPRVPSIDTREMTSVLLMDSGATAMLPFPRTDWRAGTAGQANPDHQRQLVVFITVRTLPSTVASR